MFRKLKDFKRSLAILLACSLLPFNASTSKVSAESVKPTVNSNISLATTMFKSCNDSKKGLGYDCTEQDGVWKYYVDNRWVEYTGDKHSLDYGLYNKTAIGLYSEESILYSISFPDSEQHWYEEYGKDNIVSVKIKNSLGEESESLLKSDIVSYLGIGSYKFSNIDVILSLMFKDHLSNNYDDYARLENITAITDESKVNEVENLAKSWLSDNEFSLEIEFNNGVVLSSELDMLYIPYVYDNRLKLENNGVSCVSFKVNYFEYCESSSDTVKFYGSYPNTALSLWCSVPTAKTVSSSEFQDLLERNKKIAYVDSRDENFSTLYVDVDSTDDLIIPLNGLSRDSNITKFSFGDTDIYRKDSVKINNVSDFSLSESMNSNNVYKLVKNNSNGEVLGYFSKSDSDNIWDALEDYKDLLCPLEYNNTVYWDYNDIPKESINAVDFLTKSKTYNFTDTRYTLNGDRTSLPVDLNKAYCVKWKSEEVLLNIKSIKDKSRVNDLLVNLVNTLSHNQSLQRDVTINGYSMSELSSDQYEHDLDSYYGSSPVIVDKGNLSGKILMIDRLKDIIKSTYTISNVSLNSGIDINDVYKDEFTGFESNLTSSCNLFRASKNDYKYRIFLPVSSPATTNLIKKMYGSIGSSIYAQIGGSLDSGTYNSSDCYNTKPSQSFDGYYILKFNNSSSSTFISYYNDYFGTSYESIAEISKATGSNLVSSPENLSWDSSEIYYKFLIDDEDFMSKLVSDVTSDSDIYYQSDGDMITGSIYEVYYNKNSLKKVDGYYILSVSSNNSSFLNIYNNYYNTSFSSNKELSNYLNKGTGYMITLPNTDEKVNDYKNSNPTLSSYVEDGSSITIKVPAYNLIGFILSNECIVVEDKLKNIDNIYNNVISFDVTRDKSSDNTPLFIQDISNYTTNKIVTTSYKKYYSIVSCEFGRIYNNNLDVALDAGLDFIEIKLDRETPELFTVLRDTFANNDDCCIELNLDECYIPKVEFKPNQDKIKCEKDIISYTNPNFGSTLYKSCRGIDASSISSERALQSDAVVSSSELKVPNSSLSDIHKGDKLDILTQVRSFDSNRDILNAVNASVASLHDSTSLESGVATDNSSCLRDGKDSDIKYIDYKFGNVVFASKPSAPLNLTLEDNSLTWTKPIDEGLGYKVKVGANRLRRASVDPAFISKTDDVVYLEKYRVEIEDSNGTVVYKKTITYNGEPEDDEFSIPTKYLSDEYKANVYAINKIGVSDSAVLSLGTGQSVPNASITVTTDKTNYKAGETITYTETIRNTGSVDLSNVKVTQQLDGEYVSTLDAVTEGKVATIANLPSGNQVVLKYKYTISDSVSSGDVISNKVNVKSDEGLNKDATKTVTIVGDDVKDLSLLVLTDKSSYKAGDTVILRSTVKNTGTVDLTDVEVIQQLDGTYVEQTGISVSGKKATIATLPVGDSVTLEYKIVIPDGYNNPILSNKTTAKSDNVEKFVVKNIDIDLPNTPTPTVKPTSEPTQAPAQRPYNPPVYSPTKAPTAEPTKAPTAEPTVEPTVIPTSIPVPEYKLTVEDVYYNEDGTKEKSEERLTTTVKEGEQYSYSSLDKDDYIVRVPKFEGTVTSDVKLVFEYDKKKSNDLVVQGYVKKSDGTPVDNSLVEIVDEESKSDITDNTGFYRIEGVSEGEHDYILYSGTSTGSSVIATCKISVKDNNGKVEVTFNSDDSKIDTQTETGIIRIDATLFDEEVTPSPEPTEVPTPEPTVEPTVIPTVEPTPVVTTTPAVTASPEINPKPTVVPPSDMPTPLEPDEVETPKPTKKPIKSTHKVVGIPIYTPEPDNEVKEERVTLVQTGLYDNTKSIIGLILTSLGVCILFISLKKRNKK